MIARADAFGDYGPDIAWTANQKITAGGMAVPIFEYKCQTCGETFECFSQRAGAIKPPVCPSCGSAEAERVFSVFAGRVEGGSGRCGTAATGGG